MTTREKLIDRWQAQLAASEAQAESGSRRWLWQMRVRLYRFLLLCYGSGEWKSSTPLESDLSAGKVIARQPLIDNTDSMRGLAPKSPERIRSTLKTVRVANDRPDTPGPYSSGQYHFEWIRVASFRFASDCQEYLAALKAAGIEYRRGNLVRHLDIEVQRAEFDAALDIVEALEPKFFAARTKNIAAAQILWQVVAWFVSLNFGLIATLLTWLAFVRDGSSLTPMAQTGIVSIPAFVSVICFGFLADALLRLAILRYPPVGIRPRGSITPNDSPAGPIED